MIRKMDDFLNRTTMYRLTLYYVAGLAILAFALGTAGWAATDPARLAFSAVVVLAVCWTSNTAFARIARVPANIDSVYITAFIILLIMPPVDHTDAAGLFGIVLASFAAVASKFLVAVRRSHIFNPVAFGVAIAGYLIDQPATWWVDGNPALVAAIVAGGLLVVRKVRRFDMVATYLAANIAVTLIATPPAMAAETLKFSVLYSPLFFLGFAMLTEPLTAPHGRWSRIVFGALVGLLASPAIHLGSLYLSPEMALLVGNLFAFLVTPAGRFRMTLKRIEKSSAGTYDYVLEPDRRLNFEPGQYLDWTLHVPNVDDRGNRRPFTVASAPGEREVRLGIKFYRRPSSYKRALARLQPGDTIHACRLAGTFTLPRSTDRKLAFIAGGIGVTPFRSMIQHMIDRQEVRPVVMLYGSNSRDEIAYSRVFERAREELGLHTVYAVADAAGEGEHLHPGFIDEDLIVREVPDFRERTFYISGPRSMVDHYRRLLRRLGVRRTRIKVDFFPGFA